MTESSTLNPMVSIGVATYNRPKLLERALTRLTAQTYGNLEIVVSDNASPDEETSQVVASFMARDRRVSYFRHPANLGAAANFFSVFGRCTGEFFMWAADDDQWEPWFVEKCVDLLRGNPACVAAITEVQYVGESSPYPFFPEGEAFYQGSPPGDALLHLLCNNYGNLVYSVFRRKALLAGERLFWEAAQLATYNEIAPLLHAANSGGFVVSPEIGMYKQVPESVYRQARWEYRGGSLPEAGRVRSLKSALLTVDYHLATYRDIKKGVGLLSLAPDAEKKLLKRARLNLFKHLIHLLAGHKPVRG